MNEPGYLSNPGITSESEVTQEQWMIHGTRVTQVLLVNHAIRENQIGKVSQQSKETRKAQVSLTPLEDHNKENDSESWRKPA